MRSCDRAQRSRVGWVERSDTHHPGPMGIASSTHPTKSALVQVLGFKSPLSRKRERGLSAPPECPAGALSPIADKVRSYARASWNRRSGPCPRFGFPEKYPSAPKRPFRRPSETGAQEVMRHGCRESPDGLQGRTLGGGGRLVRASVAGEFARVARLHRARMAGQAFLVPFVAFDKRDSPEGAKQKISADSERRATPSPHATGYSPSGQRKRCSR